jgi:predicted permease
MPELLARLLLLAFPKDFRDRLGRPMLQVLISDARTVTGRRSPWRLFCGGLDLLRAGLAERLARRTARAARRGLAEAWWQDVRYGVRRLAQSRLFTTVALLILTLGIGANTSIFQLLDAVELRPLPVPHPDQLAEIRIRNDAGARGSFSIWHAGATNAIWEQIRDRQDAFSGVFAWSTAGLWFSPDRGDRQRLSALLVSGGFFSTLGVQAERGRLITAADDTRGCSSPALVLSHTAWRTAFNGDPDIVGRSVPLDGITFRVVGVTPPAFTGLAVGSRFDLAVPLCVEGLPAGSPSRLDDGTAWFLVVMGRLKPGVTLNEASARLAAQSPGIFDASLPPNYPADSVNGYRNFRLHAIDARAGISLMREQYGTVLWLLQATAFLVLLVGGANLANLMLARGATRGRELATRAALGASRAQLVRVTVVETLLLSGAGAVLGAWLARALDEALLRFLDGGSNALLLDVGFDWKRLAFVALAATLTCALAGLVPAWRATRLRPADALRGDTRTSTGTRGGVGVRQALVVAQVALSLTLLTGALLFTRSLLNLVLQDPGLNPENLTIAYVDTSRAAAAGTDRRAFWTRVERSLAAAPGIVSAGAADVVPLSGSASDNDVWLDGIDAALGAGAYFNDVSPGYFTTVGQRLIAGRLFDDRVDTPDAPPAVIVNQAFVRRFTPDGPAIGRRLWRQARPNAPATRYDIVGVVSDAKYRSLREPMSPTVYVARSQAAMPGPFAQMLVRTSMPAALAGEPIRAAFRAIDPAIVPTFGNYRRMVDRSLSQDQLLAALSLFFGGLAVVLAVVGLYGAMSFAVAARSREMAVRVALGAGRARIVRLVLAEAMWLVLVGSAIGTAAALALGRSVASLLYAMPAHDPAAFAAAIAGLAAVALAACLLPARRAARVDPVTAFRGE